MEETVCPDIQTSLLQIQNIYVLWHLHFVIGAISKLLGISFTSENLLIFYYLKSFFPAVLILLYDYSSESKSLVFLSAMVSVPPPSVHLSQVNGTTLRVAWEMPPSLNISGYKLRYSIDGTVTGPVLIPVDVNQWTLTDLGSYW